MTGVFRNARTAPHDGDEFVMHLGKQGGIILTAKGEAPTGKEETRVLLLPGLALTLTPPYKKNRTRLRNATGFDFTEEVVVRTVLCGSGFCVQFPDGREMALNQLAGYGIVLYVGIRPKSDAAVAA